MSKGLFCISHMCVVPVHNPWPLQAAVVQWLPQPILLQNQERSSTWRDKVRTRKGEDTQTALGLQPIIEKCQQDNIFSKYCEIMA